MPVSLSLNQKKTLALFEEKEHLGVKDISSLLGLPIPTAKQILTRLRKLDFIERSGLGRGAYYFLKNKEEILDKTGRTLVKVYSGATAFKKLFDSIVDELNTGDSYRSYSFRGQYHHKQLADFFVSFHSQLTEKGVNDRTIIHKDAQDVILRAYRAVPKLKIRITTEEVPVGIVILDDRIINLIWDDQPLAISITSSIIAGQYKKFFDSVWKRAKDPRK